MRPVNVSLQKKTARSAKKKYVVRIGLFLYSEHMFEISHKLWRDLGNTRCRPRVNKSYDNGGTVDEKEASWDLGHKIGL